MSRLTQLHDLLTEHGGTLSYAALAGMMDCTEKAIAAIMAQARSAGVAHNRNKKGHSIGGVAQLTEGATAPVPLRRPYVPLSVRLDRARAALAEHPHGLTRLELSELVGCKDCTAGSDMRMLTELGEVISSTAHSNIPAIYRLMSLTAPSAPQQPVTRTQSHSYPTQPLTGELGAARKLLAGLNSKTPRALACAGNYRYGRAEELFSELRAQGYVS